MPYKDPAKERECQRKRRSTEEWRIKERERQRKLRLTPEWKKWSFEYNRSQRRKEVAKKFYATEKSKSYFAEWRKNNKEKCKAASLAWYHRNAEKICAKRPKSTRVIKTKEERAQQKRDSALSWYYRNKDKVQKYHRSNKHKTSAWWIVSQAIKDGVLKREGCIFCGDEKTDGHHADYSKPLEVLWVCRKHHAELHRKARS